MQAASGGTSGGGTVIANRLKDVALFSLIDTEENGTPRPPIGTGCPFELCLWARGDSNPHELAPTGS